MGCGLIWLKTWPLRSGVIPSVTPTSPLGLLSPLGAGGEPDPAPAGFTAAPELSCATESQTQTLLALLAL
jgi:hypothetical protein